MKIRLQMLNRYMGVIHREIPADWIYLHMGEEDDPSVLSRCWPIETKAAEEAGRTFWPAIKSSFKPLATCWTPDIPQDSLPQDQRRLYVLGLPLAFGAGKTAAIFLGRRHGCGEFSRMDLQLLNILSVPLQQLLHSCLPEREAHVSASGNGILLGSSSRHARVLRLIERVRDVDTPVFISGESGTGKELVAKTIHNEGNRRQKSFLAVNCCAIPEHLLESELFGFARGAFTGAFREKRGLIEEADGGTFFLDEVGDLPSHLQAKLLRLLQEREIRRVGETRTRKVDVRFISATHRQLEKEVLKGNFRKDLYFRLKIISIHIAPLRERRDDIPVLLDYFLKKYSMELGKKQFPSLSPRAVSRLLCYDWPGNVRELQNEIQRFLILNSDGSVIGEECLSPKIQGSGVEGNHNGFYGFFEARADFERNFIREALYSCGFHKEKTAAKLGLSRQGLYKLIKKHQISKRDEKELQADSNFIDQSEVFC